MQDLEELGAGWRSLLRRRVADVLMVWLGPAWRGYPGKFQRCTTAETAAKRFGSIHPHKKGNSRPTTGA